MNRDLRRQIKNLLWRTPETVRRPVARFALRSYESYLAVKAGKDATRHHNGLPIPPPKLRVLVSGTPDADWFLRGGERQTGFLRELLAAHGQPIDEMEAILDFGCGCGRMCRWWLGSKAEVHGCDYNEKLVEWTAENLSFVAARTNKLTPPLAYRDSQFDCVYALSIFTHLTEANARLWLAELARVVRPGGLVWITVHGESFYNQLVGDDHARFAAGDVVVQFSELEGTNLCATYLSREAVRRLIGTELVIIDYFDPGVDPAEAKRHELFHDAYLLKRIDMLADDGSAV